MLSQIKITNYGHLTETTQILPLENPKLDIEEQVIHEILFSPDSSLLLIVASQLSHIWSLRTPTYLHLKNLQIVSCGSG